MELMRGFLPKIVCAAFRGGVWSAVALTLGVFLAAPSFAKQNAALALDRQATELGKIGKYAEAIVFAQRALALQERAFGPDHLNVARSLDALANLYLKQGRYVDAEPLMKRSLEIRERALGPNHPDTAELRLALALFHANAGQNENALLVLNQSLAFKEKTLGPDSPKLAVYLDLFANVHESLKRYADAELLLKRSLAIREKAFGPDHPYYAASLTKLATLYLSLESDRSADAEPLFKRALAIEEKTPSVYHRIASILAGLANLYDSQRRYAEAAPLLERALEIQEKALGSDHPDVTPTLNNLANVYRRQGRYADAERLNKRVLAIREKAFAPDHTDIALTLNNLARLYQEQARYAEAEPLYKRSLAIEEKTFGADHSNVAVKLNNLASLYLDGGRYADALPIMERVVATGQAEAAIALPLFYKAQRNGLVDAVRAIDTSLDVLQRKTQTSAAAAVGKLALRLATGNDRLAQLVRRDQDLAGEAGTLDKTIIAGLSSEPSKRDAAAEQRAKERIAAVAAERASLQKTFAVEFPDYAALSNPLPMSTAGLQSLLSHDEALVAFATRGKYPSYVFVVTRDRFDWKEISLGDDALSQKVTAFRVGLDVDQINKAKSGAAGDRLFDLGVANDLYMTLFGQVEALIKDKKQLLVVPSGALTALPFHLLVTDKPAVSIPENLAGYRDAAWLIKRQAVAVLPSIGSLKALRGFAPKTVGNKPLIGFGDPVFNPAPGAVSESRSTMKTAARSLNTRSYTDYWRGAAIDRSQLSQALPQLPDTAIELQSIAQKIGVPASDIHLGQDANETVVKQGALSDYRIVYFATHALVAGDVNGVAEPSIVLSMPANPNEFDDGLLTASEVAQLKLNADWVVLSACNTIAGDKPGAEALSGLARSFFYAGARALLVSHWAVDSAAATRLTTSTFEILKTDARLGRAEALRQAMLNYLNDPSSPQNAYPAFWAPFAIIGEGAAR